jgi:hypothetical protein
MIPTDVSDVIRIAESLLKPRPASKTHIRDSLMRIEPLLAPALTNQLVLGHQAHLSRLALFLREELQNDAEKWPGCSATD